LDHVSDPVFSQKMMGEGFSFIPIEGQMVSPINGTVMHVFPTKHAIGFVAENELELLLHIGLETVELEGEGFTIQVQAEDNVKRNDPLGSFDISYIKEKGKDITSMLVIPNFKEKLTEIVPLKSGEVQAGEEIAQLILK
jgi:PTS system glucose-specific IIA component